MLKIKIICGLVMLLSAPFLLPVFEKIVAADDFKTTPLTRISSPDKDTAEPSLAAAPDGGVYLISVEHLESGGADVFLQKFDQSKNPVGEKIRVNPQPGEATAWRGDPPTIAVSGNQTIYVGWTARVETGEGKGNDLYLSTSRDGGRQFGAPVKVNDDKMPADRGMHSLAVDEKNNVYVVWLDERYLAHKKHQAKVENKSKPAAAHTAHKKHEEPNREVYLAVSTDGGKSFAPNRRVAADACPCCKTSIAAADGKIYVGWRQVLPDNFRHIAVAASTDRGNTFAPATIVSDDQWQLEGCPVTGAGLAVDAASGALNVAWYAAGAVGKKGLYWAESKDNGKTFSARKLMYEGILSGTPVVIADKDKNYRIVWQSNGKIWQLSSLTSSTDNYQIEEIGQGRTPTAVLAADEKLFIGFIKNEGDKRTVWMY